MMLRRLIGPTLITLLACVLWLDYILFRERAWSVVNFLSRFLTIIGQILGPFFSAETYRWISDTLIPGGMIVAAIVLLYLSVAAAKVAMRKATPPANAPRSPSSSASLAEPIQAAQPLAQKASSRPWKFTLAGKLTSSFAILAVLFAASVSIIAYTRLAARFEDEMKRRAELSVMGLAELALRFGGRGGGVVLRHAVENYASDSSIAYVYVEDAQGRIIAHMPRDLPAFLLRDFPRTAERALAGVELLYRDRPVYEIAARVGENRAGYVHLAIWRHATQAETRNVVTSIVVSMLLLLCAITAVFAWAVCYLTLPLSKLVLYVHRVSKGDLDAEIEMRESEAIKENNEVGSLARSFARMRSSLHAILTRLEGSQQKNPFNELR